MKLISAIAFAALMAVSGTGFAAAPTLKVTKTITIDASLAKVWDATKDFNGLNIWHPALAKDEIVEGTNNVVGAVRVLTLKDGGTIKEKLLGFDAKKHTYKYSILEGVLPLTSYTSTFTVKSAGTDKATVVWSGTFKRKNIGDHPADNENDKTATDTISSVYQAGLDNLKKMLETK